MTSCNKNKEQCRTQGSSDQISPDRGFVVEEPSMWTWIIRPFKQQLKEAKTNKTYISFSPCGMKNKSKCLLTALLLCCAAPYLLRQPVRSIKRAALKLLQISWPPAISIRIFFPVPPTPSLLHSRPTLSEERGTRPHRRLQARSSSRTHSRFESKMHNQQKCTQASRHFH